MVNSFGYLGLLIGPAIIGGIADGIGLRRSRSLSNINRCMPGRLQAKSI